MDATTRALAMTAERTGARIEGVLVIMRAVQNEGIRFDNAAWTLKRERPDTRKIEAEAHQMRAEVAGRFANKIGQAVRGAIGWVLAKRTERQTYEELMSLDDRTLADIGINRGQIPQISAGLWVPDRRANWLKSETAAQRPANAVNPPRRVA
jgi:uncharacterized protein YjiS (DUF1127 family)